MPERVFCPDGVIRYLANGAVDGLEPSKTMVFHIQTRYRYRTQSYVVRHRASTMPPLSRIGFERALKTPTKRYAPAHHTPQSPRARLSKKKISTWTPKAHFESDVTCFYNQYGIVPSIFPASPCLDKTSPLPDMNRRAICKTQQKVTSCTDRRVLHYCGIAHQKAQWPSHKRVCKAIKTSIE